MPVLPSGRRIEFSLDRFHTLLRQMERPEAQALAATLDDPDDLLFVMDTVHFCRDGMPFLAGCMAADWASYAADWSIADRDGLLAWFASRDARTRRAEAIEYIRTRVSDRACKAVSYPYVVLAGSEPPVSIEGPQRLQ